MSSSKYISTVSALVSLVLLANIAVPAISNCLVWSHCEMMERSENLDHHSEMEMDSGSEMQMDDDHCEPKQEPSVKTVLSHSVSDCNCSDSVDLLSSLVIVPSKTSISAPIRQAISLEVNQSASEQDRFGLDVLEPDISPPDLFISFESLLI